MLRAITAGDLPSFEASLEARSDPEVLVRLCERKALSKADEVQRRTVAGMLLAAAVRLLDLPERSSYERYVAFAVAYFEVEQDFRRSVHDLLERLPPVPLPDLLNAAQTAFRRLVRTVAAKRPRHSRGSVAMAERELHHLNGSFNDVASAVARCVNEAARIALQRDASPLGRRAGEDLAKTLERATLVTVRWNALEWAFDCVSFGDLKVTSASCGTDGCFDLEHVDPRLTLIRITAIRRDLMLKHFGDRQLRWVREKLASTSSAILAAASDFYEGTAAAVGGDPPDAERLRGSASSLLVHVDVEDDLALAAIGSDATAATHYTVAFAFLCFAAVAGELRRSDPMRYRRRLACPPIPLELIRSILAAGGGSAIGRATDALTTVLPARSHHDLLRTPFLREDGDVVRPFLGGDFGTWTTSVRERLIAGGAAGDAVGKTWETFYARSFEGSDWAVVGRGVKLRHEGTTLTDVDLMVVRDDLLLIVQIKALIGSGATPYDHWRNRKTIELGCSQARVAADFLDARPGCLASIMGRRVAERVRKVQPVVLTNLCTFDGWRHDDVPVMGETIRRGITEGSRVEYKDAALAVVSMHEFVRPEDLSTETVLWLLDHPIELEIAPERLDMRWVEERFGPLRVRVAEFALADQDSPC